MLSHNPSKILSHCVISSCQFAVRSSHWNTSLRFTVCHYYFPFILERPVLKIRFLPKQHLS